MFDLVLPSGWERVPVDDGIEHRLQTIADGIIEQASPGRRPAVRGFIRGLTGEALAGVRSHHATDLILPLGGFHGEPAPMSMMASAPEDVPGSNQAETLVLFAGRGRGAKAIEVDGRMGVRRVQETAATERSPARRTVAYLVAESPSAWLLITVAILRNDDRDRELADALESLADAMVSTLRFHGEGARI